MQFHKDKEKVLIIDFGSQVTKLIGRNIRELGVYSEIITPEELKKIKNFNTIRGIIFSGGPSSVNEKKFQTVSKEIFGKKIPILGICYGLQLIAKLFGGTIKPSKKKERIWKSILNKKKLILAYKKLFKNKKISLDES